MDRILISTLMEAFHEGLVALMPVFEKAKLAWSDDDAYDPWENMAAQLFESIIGSAVENILPNNTIHYLNRYDLSYESYSNFSYISEQNTNGLTAFQAFKTDADPFDTCLFVRLDKSGSCTGTYRAKLKDVKFSFVPRRKDGLLLPEVQTLEYLK